MAGLRDLLGDGYDERLAQRLRFGGFAAAISAQACGYWILATTVGVLIYAETHDPLLLTVVTALETLPMLMISPYAGVVLDRYDRRLILAIASALQVVCVAGMAVFAALDRLDVTAMLVATLALGVLGAFDSPARGAIVPTMVRPERIQRAVAVGNAAYTAARVVGPGVAGALLATGGASLAVWAAAILYAALLPAIPLARSVVKGVESKSRKGPGFAEGLRYLKTLPYAQAMLGFSVVVGIFGWLPLTLMPAIAIDLVGADARGLGWLLSASAMGSLTGNATVAFGWVRLRRPQYLLLTLLCLAASMTALGFSASLHLSMALAVFMGLGMSTTYTVSSGLMHEALDDYYRGRLVGIQAAGVSLCPLPYLAFGLLARASGLSVTLLVNAAIIVVLGLWLTCYAMRVQSRTADCERV